MTEASSKAADPNDMGDEEFDEPVPAMQQLLDNPECVSRVTPPTTIIANTSAQQAKSHAAIARFATACPGAGTDAERNGASGNGKTWVDMQRAPRRTR